MFYAKSPTEITKEIGERLRLLRLQRNIKQEDLAIRAGVSRPTLGALERCGRGSLDTLARVIYALGREGELAALLAPDPPSTLKEVTTPSQRERARP
jgi:transcriptional regulator with XRE-family HTH domain